MKRSQKMTRPTSVGIVPTTPILSGRDRTASITGPQPVDVSTKYTDYVIFIFKIKLYVFLFQSIKRREMETYKIQTLQKMLEQEKLNLERLKGETNNPSYKLSEANIRKLREQLRQVGAEVSGCVFVVYFLFVLVVHRLVPVRISVQIYLYTYRIHIYVCMYIFRCQSTHVNILHFFLYFYKIFAQLPFAYTLFLCPLFHLLSARYFIES